MAMEGMIVEDVTSALGHLGSLSSQLQEIISSTQGVVTTLESAWQGPDSSQFQAQWPANHSALMTALNALQEMHTHVQTNLAAQQQASNSY
jgi:uncharacterized protein YukE